MARSKPATAHDLDCHVANERAKAVDRLTDNAGDDATGVECPRCHKLTGVNGNCPYDADINDTETECDCCPTCRQDCADDI